MVRFTKKVKDFIAEYERQYVAHSKSASDLEALIKSFVSDTSVDVHLVSSRPKHPDSLRAKLRRKSYADPHVQLTDRIGIRVVSTYTNRF
jgi:ppGpp synthetase/RelA/SpoT-type nucleotidyltranferase